MNLQEQIKQEFTDRYIPYLNNGFYGDINGRHVHAICESAVGKKWRFVMFDGNDSVDSGEEIERAIAWIELGVLF